LSAIDTSLTRWCRAPLARLDRVFRPREDDRDKIVSGKRRARKQELALRRSASGKTSAKNKRGPELPGRAHFKLKLS
jgi:hypothetical protein